MMYPLIDAENLAEGLDQIKLFDIRWALTDPEHGVSVYEKGHIPGAVFADLDRDLSAPPGPGRHPLPTVETWVSTLGDLGVERDDHVVVYDDAGGAIAARMWWMLRSIDHTAVQLLDGGYQAWTSAGFAIEEGRNKPHPTVYPKSSGFTGVVEHEALGGRVIVDARAFDRYTGEYEPVDPKAGHIPGSINLPTGGNLSSSRTFLEPGQLAARFSVVADNPVMSCGSGVNACHNAAAMVISGREMPDIYAGSFSEWSTLDMPVSTGELP